MRRPTLTHRFEYGLFRSASAVLRALPEGIALAGGRGIGWTVATLLRIRRRVVAKNLRIAFPDRPERWRKKVAIDSYRHVGQEGAALFRLQECGPDELLARCQVDGLDRITGPLAEGRGVLILAGHLGNWELLALALSASGLPLDAVAHTQANPLFDADVRARRGRFGMRIFPRSEGTWRVLRSLQEGRVVLLLADQRVINGEIFVDFFGIPSATARGPALFALRSKAEVVVAGMTALGRSEARYRLRVQRLPVESTGRGEDGVRRLTRSYLASMEEAIRDSPEQYFWLHDRWKGIEVGREPAAGGAVSLPPPGSTQADTDAPDTPSGT